MRNENMNPQRESASINETVLEFPKYYKKTEKARVLLLCPGSKSANIYSGCGK